MRIFGLFLLFTVMAAAPARAASPAELISDFRSQHGERRVVTDEALTRVAREQANAMAAKDVLDHDVLGPFNRRAARVGAAHAAENIAYGYDSFTKTLNQWINSSGHRQNLRMKDATRVGIASARSASGRTYWAMAIAGGYDAPRRAGAKTPHSGKTKDSPSSKCRLKVLNLCF